MLVQKPKPMFQAQSTFEMRSQCWTKTEAIVPFTHDPMLVWPKKKKPKGQCSKSKFDGEIIQCDAGQSRRANVTTQNAMLCKTKVA